MDDLLLAALALVLGFFIFLSVVEGWRRLREGKHFRHTRY